MLKLLFPLLLLVSFVGADPIIKYTGRVSYDPSQPHHVRFDWSGIVIHGSRIEGSGNGLVYALIDESLPVGNIYEVVVDGVVRPRINATSQKKVYLVAQNLTSGLHDVVLRKLTEADFGVVSFNGFIQPNGQVVFNPPNFSPRSARRIEALGASFTCGYGVEGKYPCRYTPYTENYSKTYAADIARTLQAEYHVECWSGKGVMRNYGAQNITSPDPFPVDFPRALANYENVTWNFDAWQPQAVLVNIGSNDFSTQPTPPGELWINNTVQFLEGIRAKYADMGDVLHIFYSCGPKPIMTGPVCDYVQEAVARVHNTHYIDLQNVLDIPQDLGCDNHPNTVGQKKMADAVLPVIKRVMGW